MRQPDANHTGPHVAAQTAAAMTAADAAGRADALAADLVRQDQAFRDALREMEIAGNFINAPEHILGSASTKHGEIAEQVHVGIRRAFDVLHQRDADRHVRGRWSARCRGLRRRWGRPVEVLQEPV